MIARIFLRFPKSKPMIKFREKVQHNPKATEQTDLNRLKLNRVYGAGKFLSPKMERFYLNIYHQVLATA